MASMQRRETIHLSLGSSANAVTAHLLNLQGLAATGPGAPCDPSVTHTVCRPTNNSDDFVWVPRVLIVDEPSNFRYLSSSSDDNRQQRPEDHVPTWSGKVEPISPFTGIALPASQQSHDDITRSDPLELFHRQASILAYSSHSRYHAPSTDLKYTREGSRHVNWDDMDDEGDEEDEEEREFRQRRERQQWYHNTEMPIQEKLTSFWEQPQQIEQPQQQEQPHEEHVQHNLDNIPWRMFWMPPYPTQFAVPLPISGWSSSSVGGGGTATTARSSSVVEAWDTYIGASNGWNQWKDDELREQLRRVLEDCDSLQGATIVTQEYGIYAGLATELLQELQEECRTAGRFVVHIADDNHHHTEQNHMVDDKENAPPLPSTTTQQAPTDRVRNMLQRGLTLHGLASHAHVVLPVTLQNNPSSPSLFVESARLALALETATLPYRLGQGSGNQFPSKIGLNSYYSGNLTGEFPFGTAAHLSFGEYLACLQPSPQYPLIELDACTTLPIEVSNFNHALQEGTSLERDARMRQPHDRTLSSSRQVLPGAWMQNDATKGGIMTSYSPGSVDRSSNTDRSLHHHFALAASFRPADDDSLLQESPIPRVSQHVKCLMESMGVRYRPQVSVASALEQSVDRLTNGGYAAGSYWHTILWKQASPPPILTVLGNTSRVYPRLHTIAEETQQVLSSIRFRGIYNRDVQYGLLPEREDSEEALSYCLDLRDVYHPPEGSGLGIETDHQDFDT